MANEEEETATTNEPEEQESPAGVPAAPEQQAEPAQESAPDADGASEAPTEPASEAVVDELVQHPDGRFETVVKNPIRNEG